MRGCTPRVTLRRRGEFDKRDTIANLIFDIAIVVKSASRNE
jgi:hypothetical protein